MAVCLQSFFHHFQGDAGSADGIQKCLDLHSKEASGPLLQADKHSEDVVVFTEQIRQENTDGNEQTDSLFLFFGNEEIIDFSILDPLRGFPLHPRRHCNSNFLSFPSA